MNFRQDLKNLLWTLCERQFDWLEISLVYNKSDKHTTIYDSYNAKNAAKMIKSIELANISDAYSATNNKV